MPILTTRTVIILALILGTFAPLVLESTYIFLHDRFLGSDSSRRVLFSVSTTCTLTKFRASLVSLETITIPFQTLRFLTTTLINNFFGLILVWLLFSFTFQRSFILVQLRSRKIIGIWNRSLINLICLWGNRIVLILNRNLILTYIVRRRNIFIKSNFFFLIYALVVGGKQNRRNIFPL